jgi:homoserine O-succinyltransferase/O-acetyltransferase
MPVTLERPSPARVVGDRDGRPGNDFDRDQRIHVGLVNIMPDAALAATERQFLRLLQDASADFDVRLRLYALESVSRSVETRRDMRAMYYSVPRLRAARVDALIVTGAEPRAQSLPEETYWRELIGVLDFARERTRSTILSCLAAHAAVLHWDAMKRARLPNKLSGVFAAKVVGRHPLVEGLPLDLSMPHSRLNSLDEATLLQKGYLTLVRSDQAGVVVFVKDEASLLIFLQGHPEYDGDTLAREFRRDLVRYLARERETPPGLPIHYFPASNLAEVEALMERARCERRVELAGCFPLSALRETSDAVWRADSQCFYRNWLRIVAERKAALEPKRAVAR